MAHSNFAAVIPLIPNSMDESDPAIEWSPTCLRFFDYLTAVPLDRALRALTLWEPGRTFEEFAAMMLARIPRTWFNVPRYAPTGPRFEFINGRLRVQPAQAPDTPPRLLEFRQYPPYQLVSPPHNGSRRRSLNSFMAFRSYFSGVFPGIRQSVKSTLLSGLWETDPLKPHWAVMASAYTMMRDHFSVENPRLVDFIGVVAAFMGLPPPAEYLTLCGITVRQRTFPEITYIVSGPDPNTRIVPHVRPVSTYDIVEHLRHHPQYEIKQFVDSVYPCFSEDAPSATGHIAVRLEPPLIDDPLDVCFDGRIWELDIEETYSQVDDSLDPEADIVHWPICDLKSIRDSEELLSTFDDSLLSKIYTKSWVPQVASIPIPHV